MSSPLDYPLGSRAFNGARDPEVADHRPIRSKQDVVRLDIAMEDVLAMCMVERCRHVRGETQGSIERKGTFPDQSGRGGISLPGTAW